MAVVGCNATLDQQLLKSIFQGNRDGTLTLFQLK